MNFEQLVNFLRFGGPEVRTKAAQELSASGNPAVVPFLLEALNDEEPETRAAIVRAITPFRAAQAAPTLINFLRDLNFTVAESAATALGFIGDTNAVKGLIELSERGKYHGPSNQPQHDSVVQSIIALGRIKDGRATATLVKTLKQGYRKSLSDWHLQVRQAAALGLGFLDTPEGNEALIEALREDERPEIRDSTITALGMLRSPHSFQQLTAALSFAPFEDESLFWRRLEGCTIALGQRGERAAVPYLLPLVNNTYAEIRIALSQTLVRLGETDRGDVLIKLLRDRTSDVRAAAATALGALGIQSAAGPLSAVVVDPDHRVAGAANAALENLKALPSAPQNPNLYLPPGNTEETGK